MPAPISVIIPTLNAEKHLPACFAALSEALAAGLLREVIVVDGGSNDSTLSIARTWGAEILERPASRGGQLRAGGQKGKGEYLLFLHADTVLEEGWSKSLPLRPDMPAYYFRLAFNAVGFMPRLVETWANFRSRFLKMPYGDQGLLLCAHAYHSAGGFQDIPLMEDIEIIRALRGNIQMLPAIALTDASKYRSKGWVRCCSRNFIFVLRYFLGADVQKLAAAYRK